MDLMRATQMSQNLKALCDINRIRILEILVQGEHCVSDLVKRLEIDQPKVSHHLAILRSARVIRSRRDGRHINYSIRPNVHQRSITPTGPVDVFDLEELSVTFRFHELAKPVNGKLLPPSDRATGSEAAGTGRAIEVNA